MLAQSETPHILEHKKLRIQFGYDANKVRDKTVSGVVKSPLSDHAEPLAGWAAKNNVYFSLADS